MLTYGKVNFSKWTFQNDFSANLSSDSDSSQKTVWRNCLSFLDILRGSWSNKQKTQFLRVSLTYPYFSRFFANLINFQLEYWKNEDSLCSYFFERNLNLQSDFENFDFEIFIFLYFLPILTFGNQAKNFENCFFLFTIW